MEWSGIPVIAWYKITCSRGQIIDFGLMIPCHIDGLMNVNFLMMDDMSLDGLWGCNEESMEDRHHGGQ